MLRLFALLLVFDAVCVLAQGQSIPNTWPQDYPGKPSGDFSPEWQNCKHVSVRTRDLTYSDNLRLDFEVKDPLPNVTVPLTRSFAGSIPVNRAGHPNDTLFFWAFEKQNGSLTVPANKTNLEPWVIWLQGG